MDDKLLRDDDDEGHHPRANGTWEIEGQSGAGLRKQPKNGSKLQKQDLGSV